jgi:hypothetical protein
MKKIKIRFIKRKGDYLIQKKGFFGWRYIGYTFDVGYGSIFFNFYCEKEKEKLLEKVLENHYKIDKRFANITEYPMIKIY